MEWKRLLVPLDGSPHAEAALPYARAVTRATGAAATLLMVRLLPPAHGPSEAEALTYLESRAEPWRAAGLRVTTRTLEGSPADAIREQAERQDVDAVVMATHGRGGVARLVAGSVADRVLREGLRPALVIRPPEMAERGQRDISLKRIVVPLDGSALAEAALVPALALARAARASVALLRVEPPGHGKPPATGGSLLPDVTRIDEQQAVAAGLYLADTRAALPPDVRVEAMVLRGTPGAVLPEVLAGEGVDLVVMSTHGRGGLRRLLLGSVADRIVRAGVPALLIRPWPAVDDTPIFGRSVTP